MRKRVYFSLVLIFSTLFLLSACNNTKEPENGLLWRISGNGLDKPSYLFGTWHGSGYNLPDNTEFFRNYHAFNKCFDLVEQCITEVILKDGDSPMQSTEFRKAVLMPTDTTYQDLLTKEEIHQLDSITLEYLGTTSKHIHIKPTFLMTCILVEREKKKKREGDLSEISMDFYLTKKAQEKGYSVAGLETIKEQFDMLAPIYGGSLAYQVEELRKALKPEKYDLLHTDSLMNIVVDAYLEHDLFKVDSLLDNMPIEKIDLDEYIQTTLMKERNQKWVDKIIVAIQDKPSIIAVGARHLPGEHGLINLLRQQGYKVEVVENYD